ncbi:hypothetical protein Tco_1342871 [Tanacetum coccineum]
MANLSEDIQCARSDTGPPMLDRTDFASWQQQHSLLLSRGQQNRGQGNNARGAGATGYWGAQNTELGMLIHVKQGRLSATTATNGVALDEEQLFIIAGGQDNTIDKDVDEQPVQDLALNVDKVFQANECDAFDSDVDEDPMAHTMMKPVRLMIRTFYLSM